MVTSCSSKLSAMRPGSDEAAERINRAVHGDRHIHAVDAVLEADFLDAARLDIELLAEGFHVGGEVGTWALAHSCDSPWLGRTVQSLNGNRTPRDLLS